MKPILYEPRYLVKPSRLIDVPTAWTGIESILHDLIARFCPDGVRALDIGVDYGYSTVALSNYFASVTGVDTFEGDEHAGMRGPEMYEQVRDALLPYPNIRLSRCNYKDFFAGRYPRSARFDLCHIDIDHSFESTLDCGRLACRCSDVVLFHDTRSFPEVMRAVEQLSDGTNSRFYEWPECHGLGILVL